MLASVLGTKEGNGSPNHGMTEEDEENPGKTVNEIDKDNDNDADKDKLVTTTNSISSAVAFNLNAKLKVYFHCSPKTFEKPLSKMNNQENCL